MSLVAWFPLNGDLKDYSGNKNNLNYINNNGKLVINTNGKIGKCYNRAVVNDGADCLRSAKKVNLAGDFTFACWTYVTGVHVSTANGIVTNHDHSLCSGSGINICYISGTDFRISCNTGDGSTRTFTTYYGTTNIKDKWCHLLLKYEKTTNKLSLWVNGIKELEITYNMYCISDYIDIFNWSTANNIDSNYRPSGKVNDVRVYDHALSLKEIKEISKAKILHYTFDDFQEPTTNLCPVGTAVGGTGWTREAFTGTITANAIMSPSGKIDASRVNMTAGYLYWPVVMSAAPGKTYTFSCWVRSVNGGNISNGGLFIWCYDGAGGGRRAYIPTTITYEWQRLQLTYTALAGETNFAFGVAGAAMVLPYDVYVWGAQVEEKDHVTEFTSGSRKGSVKDSSGFRNDGTIELVTSPQWIKDSKIGGGAYYYNGNVARYIKTSKLSIFDNYTISFWAKRSIEGKMIFEQVGSKFYWYGDNSWAYFHGGVAGEYYYNHGASIPVDTWGHFVIVYNGATVEIFRNGVSEGTKATTGLADFTNEFTIGYGFGGSYLYKGYIDDFRIYTTALSQNDILELYKTRANIDDKGNMSVCNINEKVNIAYKVDNAINKKALENGLDLYAQPNCQVTLTDNGYRIYRPPNLVLSTVGNTMWGGLKVNLFDIDPNILMKGHKYRISFTVTGQSSNAANAMYFDGAMGWGSGTYGISSVAPYKSNSLEAGFNGQKEIYAYFNITDNIYKICTANFGPYTAGSYLNCYLNLCFGFTYQDTGVLGTDIYITNFRIEDITDQPESSNIIDSKGIISPSEISDIGITDGLIGWWPLNGDAKDYSGFKNNGSISGPVIAQGLDQLCYNFAYTTDTINIGTPSNITPLTKEVSISAWIYSADITKNQNILSMNGPYFLRITGSTIRCCVYAGSSWTFVNGTIPLASNTWYHLVLSYDGKTIKGYVNGVLDVNTPKTGALSIGGYMRIGYTVGGEDAPFGGKIQDVRLYKKGLTQEEVKILYEVSSNITKYKYTNNGKLYISNKIEEML